MTADRTAIHQERDRVTHRLSTMPVNRINQDVVDKVQQAAQAIVERTSDPTRPRTTNIPAVGASALAAQISIVVRDYLDATTAASEDTAVAQVLIDLRRSLP